MDRMKKIAFFNNESEVELSGFFGPLEPEDQGVCFIDFRNKIGDEFNFEFSVSEFEEFIAACQEIYQNVTKGGQ